MLLNSRFQRSMDCAGTTVRPHLHSFVNGITLKDVCLDMVVGQTFEICDQLRNILEKLLKFRQDPFYPFIGKNSQLLKPWAKFLSRNSGSVDGQHKQDITFETRFANHARTPAREAKGDPHSWHRRSLGNVPVNCLHPCRLVSQ